MVRPEDDHHIDRTRFKGHKTWLLLGAIAVSIVVFVLMGVRDSRPSPAPVVESIVEGDEAAFAAAVDLETNEHDAFVAAREAVGGLGQLRAVSSRTSYSGDKYTVRWTYDVEFERGRSDLDVTWKADDIVGFEFD